VIGTAPVGRDPVDVDGPHHLAADRQRGFVYVALSYPALGNATGPHAAHGGSTRAGFIQKLALDDLRVLGEVRIDPNPGDIVLSEDKRRIVVTHFDLKRATDPRLPLEERRANLIVVDPEEITARSPAPRRVALCLAPHGTVLSRPDGRFAYVACYGEDALAVVDLADPAAPVLRVPVGPGAGAGGTPIYGPYSLVMSPDGSRLAVGNTESKDVRFFDVATRKMTPEVVDAGGAPYFVAWSSNGETLFVPTQSPDALRVVRLGTSTTTVLRTLAPAECQRPHEIAMSREDRLAYVVCEGDHKGPSQVLAVDPATLATRQSFPVGVYPDRFFVMERP
jgi:DNA-binding beta-propeller fold protein YncE